MHKITSVNPCPGAKLILTYSNGRTITVDLEKKIAAGGVFSFLSDPDVFSRVKIVRDGRGLEWPGEIDLCADALWYEGTGETFSISSEAS